MFLSIFSVCNSCFGESRTGMHPVTFFAQFSEGKLSTARDVELYPVSGLAKLGCFVTSNMFEEICSSERL